MGVDFISVAGVAAPFRFIDFSIATAVDALGILVHPLPYFLQNLHRLLRNTALCIRTHIQEQVAALAYNSEVKLTDYWNLKEYSQNQFFFLNADTSDSYPLPDARDTVVEVTLEETEE